MNPDLARLKVEEPATNVITGAPAFPDSAYQLHPLLSAEGVRRRNELVSDILARRPLIPPLPDGGASPVHKWKIGFARVGGLGTPGASRNYGINPLTGRAFFSDSVFQSSSTLPDASRLWRIFVGSGCVNDEIAGVTYLRKNDPRGWEMPENYGPFKKFAQVFGPDYPFVDRPLYETKSAPHVLLTAPDAAEKDLGGFAKLADQIRPPFFRTARMWERNCYRAAVIVSQSPWRSDPSSLNLAIGGAVPARWRIQAGLLPAQVAGSGVSATAYYPLARLYLTRQPGKPELDQLYVEQLTFWSLASRSALNQSLLDLAGAVAEAGEAANLGLLALGPVGLVAGTGLLGIETGLTDILLDQLDDIVASTSSVEFWSM